MELRNRENGRTDLGGRNCIGGKEANRHDAMKIHEGHGTAGKTAVAGLENWRTNSVQAQMVTRTDTRTLQRTVHRRTAGKAQVYANETRAYEDLRSRTAPISPSSTVPRRM